MFAILFGFRRDEFGPNLAPASPPYWDPSASGAARGAELLRFVCAKPQKGLPWRRRMKNGLFICRLLSSAEHESERGAVCLVWFSPGCALVKNCTESARPWMTQLLALWPDCRQPRGESKFELPSFSVQFYPNSIQFGCAGSSGPFRGKFGASPLEFSEWRSRKQINGRPLLPPRTLLWWPQWPQSGRSGSDGSILFQEAQNCNFGASSQMDSRSQSCGERRRRQMALPKPLPRPQSSRASPGKLNVSTDNERPYLYVKLFYEAHC